MPNIGSRKKHKLQAASFKQQATSLPQLNGKLQENRKENMSAIKKKSETCEEQLRRMCKDIAEGITEGKSASHWFDDGNDVYNIEWITHQDKSYKAARLLVAGGGPNIWVNLQTGTVDGYWGCDKVSHGFIDNMNLDEYLEELYGC